MIIKSVSENSETKKIQATFEGKDSLKVLAAAISFGERISKEFPYVQVVETVNGMLTGKYKLIWTVENYKLQVRQHEELKAIFKNGKRIK